MKKQNCCLYLCFLTIAVLYWECLTPAKTQPDTPASRLAASFENLPEIPDTLHFFLPEKPSNIPVSDTLLKMALDSAQYENLHFDTGEAHFWAQGKFSFTKDIDACLLQTEEFWFGKLTLLLYDKKTRKFLTTLEVANFYGGDGGQVAVESWLLPRPAPPRIFIKNAEHGFSMAGEDEPREYLSESGALLQWQSPAFTPVANPDSAVFLQKLKMNKGF